MCEYLGEKPVESIGELDGDALTDGYLRRVTAFQQEAARALQKALEKMDSADDLWDDRYGTKIRKNAQAPVLDTNRTGRRRNIHRTPTP